jgi:mannose-6-phosphate isomerase
MADLFKLSNQIKHYEWGSPDFIPRLLGIANNGTSSEDGAPWAELWMGAHPALPSRVSSIDGAPSSDGEIGLGELIAQDPPRYLGEKTAQRYGALPFLFKLLAAEKPLSIQAHPNLALAREGFERENRIGLALDAPTRNYKDSNHKPEIVCALTPFTAMCGFREPVHISRLLATFLGMPLSGAGVLSEGSSPSPEGVAIVREGFVPLLRALALPDTASALRNFLNALFGLSREVRKALAEYIISANGTGECDWDLMRRFARLYPGDPAVIAPLYLNVFRLEPGEAIFLKAGVLHAYVHGLGVELMANSDNVLRGGLSAKHIDISELMKALDFSPHQPQLIKPETDIPCFTYPTPCEEFSLTVMHGSENTAAAIFPRNGPSICIVSEGEVAINGMVLKQGESAFIPPAVSGEEPLVLRGCYTLYAASVPQL